MDEQAARTTPPDSKIDERRRRRALYAPPPRLTETTPLTGRLVWHIGDWGRASEHIGGRWEAVAPDLLTRGLEPSHMLLVLAHVPERMAEVLGSGLSHADALRAWRGDDALELEPLDFKWSLETAARKQVSIETLSHLLDVHLPRLDEALGSLRDTLGVLPEAAITLRAGRFVAPRHPSNQAALQADPNLPCVLLPVDPQEFFRPLPGWPVARALARLEGRDLERLDRIDQVERYYRLGAGILGAFTRTQSPLFNEEPAPIDAVGLVEQRHAGGRTAPELNKLLLEVEAALKERRTREERLTALARRSYPFGQARADLARARVPRRVLDSRGMLGRIYGEVVHGLEESIRADGRLRAAAGATEDDALGQLESQEGHWRQLGQERTQRLAELLNSSEAAPRS